MHQIRSPHRWIRQHFFQIYIDAPQGVPGVSKNSQNMLQIKVLGSWPFGSQNIKNRVFGFEFFPFIFLCVILLRQIQFLFALKKLKKPPSKVVQKYSKKNSPIAAKTAQTKEFIFQNVAYSSIVYKASIQRYTYRVLQTIQMKLLL